jgi:hypothetical protein
MSADFATTAASTYEMLKIFAHEAAENAGVPGRVTSNGQDVMIHLAHEAIDALPLSEIQAMSLALLRALEQFGVHPQRPDRDAIFTLRLGGAILLK